jgi:O-antigen/teichoic acid export membrane protein
VSRPGSTLRLCAALVGLQALGLAGIAVFYLVELAVATSDDRVRALVTAGLALAAAAGLALVARGLLRRRRWARSPALVTNLLVLPVAVGLLQGGRWYAGVPLLVWALAVLGLLFAPATAAALDED